jgi:hypothetical protein
VASIPSQIGSDLLLNAAVIDLGFDKGELFSAGDQLAKDSDREWVEKGDWLTLAKFVGAESLFFVDQNPVIVFARTDTDDRLALRKLYNRIWCMARPQLLFLARPGELSVYDLSKPPVSMDESIDAGGRLLSETVRAVANVQTQLAAFRREEIETGQFFDSASFKSGVSRADRALIKDLRTVREQLLNHGLDVKYAHSLIGRSIFIRYLEDREVLKPEYFDNVAQSNARWMRLLNAAPVIPPIDPRMADIRYLRVLEDHGFAYRLFDQLAQDFNGDMFPVDAAERSAVTSEHLALLRSLLTGNTSVQQQLFFYAYSFDVIPIELISSIYEEFYNEQKGKSKNHGSHYTPSALVDFVLTRTLSGDILDHEPRVLDPACGSGIFLVEAFRRIVRHQTCKQGGRRLSRPQLRRILRDQIAGIDINEEAIRVAAFSLYLAFLHYQEPREINEQRRLPNLKWNPDNQDQRDQYFNILLHGNAFALMGPGRHDPLARRFGAGSADVVVGNPPWGYPKSDDSLGREALNITLRWCRDNHVTVGDKELSQAFLHLSNFLLREDGKAGVLVSTGVFFKQHPMSRRFRRQWLGAVHLDHVVNFAQVRHLFFRGGTRKAEAIAPFAAIVFSKKPLERDHRFAYWSAKRTALVESTQAVVLSTADMSWLSQQDCIDYEYLWKVYWWGGHRDEALIRALGRFPVLSELSTCVAGAEVKPEIGFVEGKNGRVLSEWLRNYQMLPNSWFSSYGPLPVGQFVSAPASVRRRGSENAYRGQRLLVGRGIGALGKMTVRLERRSFCFTHSIYSFGLRGLEGWQEKVLLGIFWSDLARYYLFFTTGSWGMWHDELSMASISNMPIVMPASEREANAIVQIVDELKSTTFTTASNLFDRDGTTALQQLELRLNKAIFDLYELNVAERDLVSDLCSVGFDFLYRKQTSDAARPLALPIERAGIGADSKESEKTELDDYTSLFLRLWSKDLAQGKSIGWKMISSESGAPLLAILFTVQSEQDDSIHKQNANDWKSVLNLLDNSSFHSIGSRQIYTDSFVRLVTPSSILLIKRNERRFWTHSAARQDAEATQLQAMLLQGVRGE